MSKKISSLLIIALVFIAIVLGVIIYQRGTSSPPSSTTAVSPFFNAPGVSTTLEEQILNFPGQDASNEEQLHHFELVQQATRRVSKLEIKDCLASPIVIQVRQGEQFTIYNNSNLDYEIGVTPDHSYLISAGGSVDIVADFAKGVGLYKYACGPPFRSAGVIYVTE